MKRLILLAAAASLAMPAWAETPSLTVQAGQWIRIFAPGIERGLGRSVRVDGASVIVAGQRRSFRQAEMLLNTEGPYPRGTTLYSQRSVDCGAGYAGVVEWSAVDPAGRIIAAGGAPGLNAAAKVHWDSPDGKTLRFVCQGILPR